jgi:hypothetical protein
MLKVVIRTGTNFIVCNLYATITVNRKLVSGVYAYRRDYPSLPETLTELRHGTLAE